MKKYICIMLGCLFCVMQAFSQALPGSKSGRYDELEYRDLPDTYYGGFSLKEAKTVNNNWGLEFGGRGGLILFNSLGIGGSFYSLFSQNIGLKNSQELNGVHLRLTYGGVETEYSFKPIADIRISPMVMFGIGRISFSNDKYRNISEDISGEWMTLVEPSLTVNYRILKGIWVGATAYYRKAMGVQTLGLTNDDLSGPAISVNLTAIAFN